MTLFSWLKQRIPILNVINQYTHLKAAGNYWKGTCPFHQEKTASFTVTPHKEIFYCFGCHVGGDVISFVEQIEKCTPLQAAHILIDRFNLTVPAHLQEKGTQAQYDAKQRYHTLCGLVAQWCYQQLNACATAQEYMSQRNIGQATIDEFKVGYFPPGPQAIKALVQFLKPHHFLVQDLLDAHIIIPQQGTYYAPFEHRIIFPIKDHIGNFCGFGGRVFHASDKRAKYYNSKENPYFDKGSLLFGFDSAKKAMHQHNMALMVEGYFDCLAMIQQGFPMSVATLGTACSLEHLQALSRHTQRLYIMYDGDQAGRNAIFRLTNLCWQANIDLYVVQLPQDEDPASLAAKGVSLTSFLQQAYDIFIFFINSMSNHFLSKPLPERLALTRQLLSMIGNIQDPLKQDFLLQTASGRLHIPFSTLKKELERLRQTVVTTPTPKKTVTEQHFSWQKISDLEKKLFSVILNCMQQKQPFPLPEEYIGEFFSQPLVSIVRTMITAHKNNPDQAFSDILTPLTQQEKILVHRIIIEFSDYQDSKMIDQLVHPLREKQWKSQVKSCMQELKIALQHGNEHSVQELLEKFQSEKKKLIDARSKGGS